MQSSKKKKNQKPTALTTVHNAVTIIKPKNVLYVVSYYEISKSSE